ncbi:probable phosphoketolase [Clostridium sp. CAG:1000]|nr:probable phosphoketolase [Clostridium sp. CAG:1000]
MKALSDKELENIKAFVRATDYLSVAQLYLKDNPLLREKLTMEHIKPNVVGHWGTAPGQNFIYAHLNRIIKKYKLDMIYVSGPGHGGQAMVANTYLEGSYSEIYPNITEDLDGLKKLCKQFSFPGGISSHVAPETPGSINEGGELGYSLAHAFGAVLDNPDMIAACVVGDGEAETGPLAASWQLNKIINPLTDGIVLPILHLNGFKIANPTILARIPEDELVKYFEGCGWAPYIVEASTTDKIHELMAKTLDKCISDIKIIKSKTRLNKRATYPMIILKTPKGWTGPKMVEKKLIEGSFRSHQVPVVVNKEHEENLPILEAWLKSYKPEELFDSNGTLIKGLKALIPPKELRMGMNPHTNGGLLLEELQIPDFRDYGLDVKEPGSVVAQDMMQLGIFIRDIIKLNENKKNFRIFGPDEALSNRLNHVFEATNRQWNGIKYDTDEYLSTSGRVIDSVLSEHLCEGMLEGYLLTGRHGFIHSYEAFIRIIDSMASQHAKWLKVTKELPWRKEISSLNYILTSYVWQQDHNGFTHQDPGFLNHLVTKKADTIRIYLPPDTNTLISCFNHCIKTKNYINVIVASKHPRLQWFNMNEAIKHCTKGLGRLEFACNDEGLEPDLVMACAGETPTIETLAAVKILRENFPKLKIRVINVVDLMKLVSPDNHPHGLDDEEYDNLFTKKKPIIFAFHGYPHLIHQLSYKRSNKSMHVHGYIEEGTITTTFDMKVQNKLDRFHLVMDALKYLPQLGDKRSALNEWCKNKLIEHKQYISEYGEDMPEIRNWTWK